VGFVIGFIYGFWRERSRLRRARQVDPSGVLGVEGSQVGGVVDESVRRVRAGRASPG
jgi:hypothetical protein